MKPKNSKANTTSRFFMKPLILPLLLLILLSAWAMAGDKCDSSLSVVPCNVSNSLTLTAGLVKACNAVSSSEACLTINASNVVLDCNGASLVGNTTGQGIRNAGTGFSNVTVKNCNIKGYRIPIVLSDASTIRYNNSIINNTIQNGFYNMYVSYQSGLLIENNTIVNCSIEGTTSYGIFGTYNLHSTKGRNNGFNIINNNNINGKGKCFAGVLLDYNSNNFNITNNIINDTDAGVFIQDSSNVFIDSNNFKNQTVLVDYYQTGIEIHDRHDNAIPCSNISILNNNIVKAGSTGIDIHSANNVTIDNNFISLLTITEKRTGVYTLDDGGDPSCGITITQIRKGFFDDTTDNQPLTLARAQNYSSSNISIMNTVFGSDIECYIRTQGIKDNFVTDMLSDYPDYYYWNFSIPKDLVDNYEIYAPKSNSNNLQMYRPYSAFTNDQYLYWAWGTVTGGKQLFWFNYSISPTQLTFGGKNVTNLTLIPKGCNGGNCSIFNITSGKAIINNRDSYNLTLGAGDSIKVVTSSASGGCDFLLNPFSIYAETSICNVNYLYFNVTNTPSYNYVKSTINFNLSLFNLTDGDYPFNTVFNSNQSSPVCSDENECNVNVGANGRVFGFSYLTNSEPRFTEVGSGVNTLSAIGGSATTTFFDCTGSGQITVTNLLSKFSEFNVYHNGAYYNHYKGADNFTTDGTCSSWEISTGLIPLASASPISSAIANNVIAVLVAIGMLLLIGYPIYRNYEEWEIKDWFNWIIISLIIVIMGLIVIQSIFAM